MYSSEVLQRFRAPQFAEHAHDDGPRAQHAAHRPELLVRAGSLSQGALLELRAQVEAQRLRSLRFRAYGSPGLIALADAFCAAAQDLPLSELAQFSLSPLQQRLDIPNTEIHVVLLLTEALQKLNTELQASTQDKLATDLLSK